MDRFLERNELPDFIQEKNNLNSHLPIKLNSQFKDISTKKIAGPECFTSYVHQTFKKRNKANSTQALQENTG